MVSEPSLITPVNLNRYMRESIIALRQDVERLTRERDRYRAVLEQIATVGCGYFDSSTTCRSTGRPRDQWCFNCLAVEALEEQDK